MQWPFAFLKRSPPLPPFGVQNVELVVIPMVREILRQGRGRSEGLNVHGTRARRV